MRDYGEIDYGLLSAVVVLIVLGAAMSLGLSPTASMAVLGKDGDRWFFFKRELVRVALAGALLLAALRINYRRLRRFILPGLILSLMLLTAALGLRSVRGARSWILGLQPVEIGRLFLVLFLAHYIDKVRERMSSLISGFLIPMVPVMAVVLLVALQPDLGSTVAIALIGFLLLYVAGAPLLGFGIGLASVTAGLTAVAITRPHVLARLQGFWLGLVSPEALSDLSQRAAGHFRNALVHTYQALVAVGSGGILGVGLGQSRQKLLFLSEPHTDFVYAIIAEEGGLLVAGSVLLIYLFIFWRGLRIALALEDRFERFVVLGLTLSLFVYAAINIMVNIGLFPITGLPLPFLSYGGSALVVNAVSVGLILNISRHRGERSIDSFSRKRYESNHSRWRDGRASLPRPGSGRSHRR